MEGERSLIAALQADFALTGEAARFDDARIAQTWRNPAAFETALLAVVERGAPRLSSSLDRAIALYSDCLLRQRSARGAAIEYYDDRAGWQSYSYAQLDLEATRLASIWRAHLSAKSVVALAIEPQPLMFAACFAAWRLGAAVCVLPSPSPMTVERALVACGATAVVRDPEAPWPLPAQWADTVLSLQGAVRADVAPPVSFAAGQPALIAVSPLGAATRASKVSARELLISALRDALLHFDLVAGRRVCAPLCDPAQWYPTLALAAFVVGATLVLIPSRRVLAEPATLDLRPLDVVVVRRALMALLDERGLVPGRHWSRALRCVEESLDWDATSRFLRAQRRDLPTANILYDAGSGGAILCSPSRPASASSRVIPAAGRPWKLEGALPTSAGVFSAKSAKSPLTTTPFLVARQGSECLYAGTLDPRRDGRAYDCEAALAAIHGLPWLRGASFVIDAVDPCTARFTLVAFCTDATRAVELRRELEARITRALGVDALPDEIALYEGFAHKKGGHVDAAWVAAQYRAGWLALKQESTPFLALARLRSLAEGRF
ncbi:MAG: AMP-binding protein [Deltaproteobacteria bacterium]|nr:AMP-binding protein [Deltaproteobacteria bacterium]